MAARGKKSIDAILLVALACGSSVENAARKAGVSERTVQRRLDDPVFQQQVKALQAEMVQRASGMLTAAGMEAVKTLVELLAPTNAAGIRLGAARSILELGTELREAVEFETRLAELEQRLHDPHPEHHSHQGSD